MKVANITEEARWGGPQVRITNVASRLRQKDIYTTVIHSTLNSSRIVKELGRLGIEREGVKMYRLTTKKEVLTKYVVFFTYEIYQIYKKLKKIDADVVHCNGAWQIKGMLAAWLLGIPAIWHLNDTSMPFAVRKIFNMLAPYIADGLISASKQTWRYYIENKVLEDKPHTVIQAPVDIEEFNPEKVKANQEIEKFRGLKVVTVSSVNPDKGIGDFIDMCKIVTNSIDKKVNFFVVGPIHDTQESYANKMISKIDSSDIDCIHFTGYSRRVERVLKPADLYVCSSKNEASPISVWEAMAMQLPVVSTDVGDVYHFLENPEMPAGSVVNVGDSVALAEEVLQFLKDDDLRRAAGRNGRGIASSQLSLDACATKHCEFYRRVLS